MFLFCYLYACHNTHKNDWCESCADASLPHCHGMCFSNCSLTLTLKGCESGNLGTTFPAQPDPPPLPPVVAAPVPPPSSTPTPPSSTPTSSPPPSSTPPSSTPTSPSPYTPPSPPQQSPPPHGITKRDPPNIWWVWLVVVAVIIFAVSCFCCCLGLVLFTMPRKKRIRRRYFGEVPTTIVPPSTRVSRTKRIVDPAPSAQTAFQQEKTSVPRSRADIRNGTRRLPKSAAAPPLDSRPPLVTSGLVEQGDASSDPIRTSTLNRAALERAKRSNSAARPAGVRPPPPLPVAATLVPSAPGVTRNTAALVRARSAQPVGRGVRLIREGQEVGVASPRQSRPMPANRAALEQARNSNRTARRSTSGSTVLAVPAAVYVAPPPPRRATPLPDVPTRKPAVRRPAPTPTPEFIDIRTVVPGEEEASTFKTQAQRRTLPKSRAQMRAR